MLACSLHYELYPPMSGFITNPYSPSPHKDRLPTDRSVYSTWKSLSINVQCFSSFTIHCQHRIMYCRTRPKIRTTIQLFIFCIAEIRLCVLHTAVGSLQSPDWDTEWIICVNVGTGGGFM